MTAELKLLVASVVLGLVHLIASSHLISWQRGYRWTASSREEDVPPLHGLANRVEQATTNFLQTFPFFVALVFVARVTGHHSLLTMLGAHRRRCWLELACDPERYYHRRIDWPFHCHLGSQNDLTNQ